MPTINQLDLVNDIRIGILPLLGTYTFPDGVLAPAFASLPDEIHGYNYPPSTVDVDGIECVVVNPTMLVSPRHNRDTWVRAEWRVFLKQWDTNVDFFFDSVVDELVCTLGEAGYRYSFSVDQPPSESLGLLRTFSLSVVDTYLVGRF